MISKLAIVELYVSFSRKRHDMLDKAQGLIGYQFIMRSATAAICIASAGCSTVPRCVNPQQASEIKNIAVVSLLGNTLHMNRFSMTAFQKDEVISRTISGWDVDVCAESTVRQLLSADPTYCVKDVHDRASVVDLFVVHGLGVKFKSKESVSRFQALKKPLGVDAVIVISERSAHFPLSNRAVFIEGNGAAKETVLLGLGQGRIALHSAIAVDVLSTSTGDMLATNLAMRWINIDEALWSNLCAQDTPLDIAGVKQAMSGLVQATTSDAILRLGLTARTLDKHVERQASTQDARFSKLSVGLSMLEVFQLLGQPTAARFYQTRNVLNPHYMGSDQARFDAFYVGEGRITFVGAGPGGCALKVFEVKSDPNEKGVAVINTGISSIANNIGGKTLDAWGRIEKR